MLLKIYLFLPVCLKSKACIFEQYLQQTAWSKSNCNILECYYRVWKKYFVSRNHFTKQKNTYNKIFLWYSTQFPNSLDLPSISASSTETLIHSSNTSIRLQANKINSPKKLSMTSMVTTLQHTTISIM